MTEKNGIVTFKCDEGFLNSTQRNNEYKLLSKTGQTLVDWKGECNVTSYVMALEYAGWKFPKGRFKQTEDNLAEHIIESEKIDNDFNVTMRALWKEWHDAKEGKLSDAEIKKVTPPIEIHKYLSMGANEWLNCRTATSFNERIDFPKALWRYLVDDNLPMVISTTFGGFGHIVCVTGVQYSKADWEKGVEEQKEKKEPGKIYTPSVKPTAIIVDDPWGNASKTRFESYPAGGGGSGNDIIVPWDIVVKKVKPLNSTSQKWAHTFNHGAAIV